jgi:N-acetylneuraminic acid mutarotase
MRKIYTLSLFSLFAISLTANPWTQKTSMGGLGRHRPFGMNIGTHGYVGGGWNGTTMYYDMWDFDPATNSWTQKANTPTLMWSCAAFGIGTKGFVLDGTTTYMYRPATNSWTIVNNSSPSASSFDQLKFVINGKGYVIGGSTIWEFDPVLYTWTPRYNVPGSFYPELGFEAGGKGYIVDTWYNTLIEYNPVSNTIAYKAGLIAPFSQGISFGVNGKGYIGLGQVPPFNSDERYMYEYDPAANSWRQIDDLAGASRENATTFVIGNKGYVCCGTNGINFNDLWEFDSNNITSVDEASAHASVSVYPNPSADGKFYVKQDAQAQTKITAVRVVDMNGKWVKDHTVDHGPVDLAGFPNALYYFIFLDGDQRAVASRKVMLAK